MESVVEKLEFEEAAAGVAAAAHAATVEEEVPMGSLKMADYRMKGGFEVHNLLHSLQAGHHILQEHQKHCIHQAEDCMEVASGNHLVLHDCSFLLLFLFHLYLFRWVGEAGCSSFGDCKESSHFEAHLIETGEVVAADSRKVVGWTW